ncbi:MAG: ArsA family ATPase [Gemmatimonadales bacterium]
MGPSTQLIVVTGKGGVGKTVVAAALGRIMADRGRRVLLLDADSREAQHRLFGAPPSGGEVVSLMPRLAVLNAVPRTILDREVALALKIKVLSNRVLASPIYQHFADGAPGLKEMMLLGYALKVAEGDAKPKADLVIIDAPGSGHGLSLLAAPLLMSEVITTGPLGHMASRIAALVADPARCAIVLPTLAEEMAVQETLETIAAMERRISRAPSMVVVNAVFPPRDGGAQAKASSVSRDEALEVAATLAFWTTRRRLNEREIARLQDGWKGRTAQVPLVAEDFGPGLLSAVADSLAPQLEIAAGAAPKQRRRRA